MKGPRRFYDEDPQNYGEQAGDGRRMRGEKPHAAPSKRNRINGAALFKHSETCDLKVRSSNGTILCSKTESVHRGAFSRIQQPKRSPSGSASSRIPDRSPHLQRKMGIELLFSNFGSLSMPFHISLTLASHLGPLHLPGHECVREASCERVHLPRNSAALRLTRLSHAQPLLVDNSNKLRCTNA